MSEEKGGEFKSVSPEELDELSKAKTEEWVVYILSSKPNPRRTYAGVTNNILHRIRQHNGEIVGGARPTHTCRPWILSALIHGFGEDKSLAMRFEWFTKVEHYKKGDLPKTNGPARRAFLINYALQQCKEKKELCVCVCKDRLDLTKEEIAKQEGSKLYHNKFSVVL